MAIIKQAELPTGSTGNYWKVTAINVSIIENLMYVSASLFISKSARLSGKSAAWRVDQHFPLPSVDDRRVNDIVKLAYDALKSLPQFSEATDD